MAYSVQDNNQTKGLGSMAQATTAATFQIDTSADTRVDLLAAIAGVLKSFSRALVAAQHAEAKFYSNRWDEKASQELRVLLRD